jgi:uncharacterized protein
VSETDSFDWLPALLVVQGVAAAIDSYRNRKRLNAVRDALYAALFLSFAWLAWQGAFAWVIGALLAAEVALALFGTSGIRGPLEPLLHLNLGAIAALLVPLLLDWAANPTELAPAHHGWMTWALTILAVVAFFNATRAAKR